MPIFRKKVECRHYVTVGIEAETQEEAQRIFEDWCDEDGGKNVDEMMTTPGFCISVDDTWTVGFDNMDEYNRAGGTMDDFTIFGRSKEQLYDLYFSYKDQAGKIKAYLECSMDKIIDELRKMNQDYILRAKGEPNEACRKDAKKRGINSIFWFEAERRAK